jgi:hypothetical protein
MTSSRTENGEYFILAIDEGVISLVPATNERQDGRRSPAVLQIVYSIT